MKKRIIALLLATMTLFSLAAPALADTYTIEYTIYSGGSAEFNGHTYQIYEQLSYWQEAQDFCESKGGHLVTITSREEQSFIEGYLDGVEADGDYMIGLYSERNDMGVWVTGEAVSYTHWGDNEPLYDENDPTVIIISTAALEYDGYVVDVGEWWAWDDDGSSFFICEWDYFYDQDDPSTWRSPSAASAPTPATTPATTQQPSSGTGGYRTSDWARAEMETAKRYGLISSALLSADLTQNITRQEFAYVSVRVYENMSGKTVSPASPNPFADTSDPDVLKAYAVGITNGVSSTAFGPNQLLTREQGAAMLARAYKGVVYSGWTLAQDSAYPLEYTVTENFADDSSISAFAANSVYFMSANSILNGVGNNRFAPKSNMTREQAIAISVRMLEKLSTAPRTVPGGDTTPGNVTPAPGGDTNPGTATPTWGGGVKGPVKGTLTSGGASVDFGSGGSGEALLVADNASLPSGASAGYDLLVSAAPSAPVTVTLDATAPGAEEEAVIYIGFPYSDGDGGTQFLWAPLDTSYSGGKATATFSMEGFADALDSIDFASPRDTGYQNRMEQFAEATASQDGFVFDPERSIAIRLTAKPNGIVYSDAVHFKILYDKALSDGTKLTEADVKAIANDLERQLRKYQDFGYSKISENLNLTMPCVIEKNTDSCKYWAFFNTMYLGTQFVESGGYARGSSYDDNSVCLFAGMGHELFHYVQRLYSNRALSSGWFDEATGAYMENVISEAFYGKNRSQAMHNNYFAEAYRQYDGMVPAVTVFAGEETFTSDGYGRKALVDFLMQNYCKTGGTDFLRSFYEQGGMLTSGGGTESRILSLTKEPSLGVLARKYYTALVTTDTLDSYLAAPWNIYSGNFFAESEPNGALDAYTTEMTPAESGGSHSFNVARYGAHFVRIRLDNLPPAYTEFNIRLPAGTSGVLMLMDEDTYTNESYSTLRNFASFNGSINAVPNIKGARYLLMVVNETDSEMTGTVDIVIEPRDAFTKWIGTYALTGITNEGKKRETQLTVRRDEETGKMRIYLSSHDKAILADYDSATQSATGTGTESNFSYELNAVFSESDGKKNVVMTETQHYAEPEPDRIINWTGVLFWD